MVSNFGVHEKDKLFGSIFFVSQLANGGGCKFTTHEQRTTILTMIIVHLDQLDVIRKASITEGQISLNAAMRENIELFSLAVVQTLFNFMSELDLDIVSGVLGLISTLNVDLIAKTRIGVSVLTMILSRAEIIRQSGGGNEQSWKMWYVRISNGADKS